MSTDSPPDRRVGTRFGPHELRALLGRGGMGEVYETCDAAKNRTVALQLLPPQLLAQLEAWVQWNESLLPSGRCAT